MNSRISPPVRAIDLYGVPNRSWTSLSDGETILSRPMAKLIREEAKIEALADDAVASSPPNSKAAAPIGPMRMRATSTTAVSLPATTSFGTAASTASRTRAYITVTITTLPMIAIGRLRPGFLISSATEVIWTKPR